MAAPPRQAQVVSGRGTVGLALDDEVVEAREAIRLTLTWTCVLVASGRGISAPADSILSMAMYLDRHGEWLAAQHRAGWIAKELTDVATDPRTWRLAHPTSAESLYLGDCPIPLHDGGTCGGRLRQYPDEPLVRCPRCGTEDTIEQWQRWMVSTGDGVVDAYAAAADLATRWWRPVDPSLIRQWSSRGKVTPVVDGDNKPTRDHRGRVLYRRADIVACAQRLWGPPPDTPRCAAT